VGASNGNKKRSWKGGDKFMRWAKKNKGKTDQAVLCDREEELPNKIRPKQAAKIKKTGSRRKEGGTSL